MTLNPYQPPLELGSSRVKRNTNAWCQVVRAFPYSVAYVLTLPAILALSATSFWEVHGMKPMVFFFGRLYVLPATVGAACSLLWLSHTAILTAYVFANPSDVGVLAGGFTSTSIDDPAFLAARMGSSTFSNRDRHCFLLRIHFLACGCCVRRLLRDCTRAESEKKHSRGNRLS